MLKPVWIVAFSGHRPGNGPGRSEAELAACRDRIRVLLEQLKSRAAERGGKIELLVSAAAGADIEAAEVANELGVAVHIILPKSVDAFKQDFEGLEHYWSRAEHQIEEAKKGTSTGTFRVAQGANHSPSCYHDTNIQMLLCSDLLIAVWNREESKGLGGTHQAVEEARSMGYPIAIINPADKEPAELVGQWQHWPPVDPTVQELNHIVFACADVITNCIIMSGYIYNWEIRRS